jgi:hypothetical protein
VTSVSTLKIEMLKYPLYRSHGPPPFTNLPRGNTQCRKIVRPTITTYYRDDKGSSANDENPVVQGRAQHDVEDSPRPVLESHSPEGWTLSETYVSSADDALDSKVHRHID